MNGELDIIPQSSLRRILSGSNVCHPNHPSLKLQLSSLDPTNFPALADCTDFECSSSGVLSACSDSVCDETGHCAPDGRDVGVSNARLDVILHRTDSSNTSEISVNCSVGESCGSIHPVTADLDHQNRAQASTRSASFAQATNIEDKFASEQSMFEEVKCQLALPDESNYFCSNQNLNQSKQCFPNTEMAGHLMIDNSMTSLHSTVLNTEAQVNNFASGVYKSAPKLPPTFSVGEPDVGDDPSSSASNFWGRYSLAASSDESATLASANDSFPLLVGTTPEHSIIGLDNRITSQYAFTPLSAAAAAKRAITGGHQTAKIGTTVRSNAWSSCVSSIHSIPSSNSGNWGCVTKVGTTFPLSSQVTSSGVSPSGSAPISWTMNQPTLNKVNNLSNILSNISLDSSTPGSTCNTRSQNVNTFSPLGSNKATNGLSNIYSMFPKRPQHRMMAHWQQQQQHHSGAHGQSMRTIHGLQNNTIHLNGNRAPVNGADVSGASGDNFLNFNSCSVLQAISSIPPSTVNSLSIGSSGDSFGTVAPSILTSTESTTPLDTFKFGLDQQLMEAIKAFGSTTVSPNNSSGLDVGTNGDTALMLGSMDEPAIPFSEMDQQFSSLSTLNQLSLLNQNVCSAGASALAGISCTNNHASSLRGLSGVPVLGSVGLANSYSVFSNIPTREEGYSRKVFVGGLPPDIDEEEITTAFRRFGPLIVDWPHKTESKAYFPPKGYCFLLFQDERSVQSLINACIVDEGKYYWCVSSPTMKDKPVQIRPWNLADSDFVMDGSQPLDPRKTIFVGGVPRPLRAIELALIMDRLYSGVCYAGIDTDPELKYPKGAGRVAFSNQQSYIAAISARFVQLQHNEIDKRVEVKPYVLDNQLCDECQGARCGGKFAPFFCANVACLQYYCEQCWVQIHSRNGREYHKPLVKEGAERPRPALYRW